MRIDGLLKVGGLSRSCKKPMLKILDSLTNSGKLAHLPGGGWALPGAIPSMKGLFQAMPNGGGTFIPEDASRQPFPVHQVHTHGAWNGDIVRAIAPASGSKNGRVIEIIEKGIQELVARVEKKQGNTVLCRPSDRKLTALFSASLNDLAKDKKISEGAMVLLRPGKRLSANLWDAEILEVFGEDDKIDVQEAIVKAVHKVPGKFPELALKQAQEFENIKLDPKGREDLRHVPLVTIDGKDAKDFDDAIFVTRQGNEWLLLVAIADVSHYVEPDERPDSLDSEALRRGNSWYFPQSVEPMLPDTLSNGLCSLKPGEDRYAMFAEIRLSADGEPLETRFGPAIIRSHARLIYDDVATFLKDGKPGPGMKGPVPDMLKDAHALYKILARKRRERGTLDFDLPEPQYCFDQNGKLQKMTFAERNDAHRMIEEFMISANEAVARHIGASKIPFLYRVHPEPEQEKLISLASTLEKSGIDGSAKLKGKNGQADSGALQEILRQSAGTPQEYLVNKLCLRSMQQARYQPDNVGHFGLASKSYCHFTSPIRRYADLLAHRALKKSLGDRQPDLPDHNRLLEIGDQLNNLERSALECERDMARRLGCFAMKEHVGEVLQGTISGVTEFGAFVEFKDIPTEGLIRLPDLGNDWYEFDAATQSLRGMRTGKSWRLGQAVNVKVEEVNTDRMEIRLTPEGIESRKTMALTNKDSDKGQSTGTGKKRKNNRPGRNGRPVSGNRGKAKGAGKRRFS